MPRRNTLQKLYSSCRNLITVQHQLVKIHIELAEASKLSSEVSFRRMESGLAGY
jgi:hypothetical protein